jgi:hypothetical protein
VSLSQSKYPCRVISTIDEEKLEEERKSNIDYSKIPKTDTSHKRSVSQVSNKLTENSSEFLTTGTKFNLKPMSR